MPGEEAAGAVGGLLTNDIPYLGITPIEGLVIGGAIYLGYKFISNRVRGNVRSVMDR